jgi:hypothetical protein
MVFAAVMAVGGCASTEMRTFVGKSVDETHMTYGQAVNVIDLNDGRRGYQYRWGGGAGIVPGRASTSISSIGDVTTATTTTVPALVFESAGCLITFIARDQGPPRGWVVEDYRVPKQMVC